MTILISFTDFWEGHDPLNNILINILRDSCFSSVDVVDNPCDADLCFVTIYGSSHKEVINKFRHKTILWLGENVRPNLYGCRFSISFDFDSYGGTNFRLPLWFSEIDWFGTGLGVIGLEDLRPRLVSPGSYSRQDIVNRDFCITIFNNPEGTRLELLRRLNLFNSVTGYGRPFGNWFPTNATYRSKLSKMGTFLFNLCLENSYYPGYYTEKCFHAKVAGVIPIYMADKYVVKDFRPASFINVNDYLSLGDCCDVVYELSHDFDKALAILNQPLLHRVPDLSEISDFLLKSCSTILSNH